MGLKSDEVLIVVKPLYGVPESGLHWFLTYQDHHVNNLGMKSTIIDNCVLYKRNETHLEGMTALQVDDSISQ